MKHFGDPFKQHLKALTGRARMPGGDGLRKAAKLFVVDPRDTDGRIREWTEAHWICVNSFVPANGRLLVFLPGSFVNADRLKLFLQCAADLGYLAINLRYPNSWTVGELCRNSDDADCHAKIRLEIAEGIPARGQLGLRAGDSIVSRLVMLLRWLDKRQPDVGWANFFTLRGLRWENIALAGHSQGSGHAALLAKRHRVARVVMLGGPADFNLANNLPASWLGLPGETSAERYFGFVHCKDPGFARTALAWETMGLGNLGPAVNVDGKRPPYSESHQLYTDLDLPNGRFHASVATDGATPKSGDGALVYEPVWQYLLGVKEED
jgi:pimeloyl-ACP methyl ester carboxylesterase